MEDEIDCLFIHQIEEGKDYQETIIMPIGLTALADFLQRNNIKTKSNISFRNFFPKSFLQTRLL